MIGFVCPAYEWDMPGTMKRFVEKLKINPNAYIFMIVTYIAIHGKSFETMEEILSAKKAHLCMKPIATMFSDFFSSGDIYDRARTCTEMALYEVVIVNLTKKAYPL